MDREQVIEELKILLYSFLERDGAYPICLAEAIRLLEEETA